MSFAKHSPVVWSNLSHSMAKPTKWHTRPTNTRMSLGIRTVWSESSLCDFWRAKDTIHNADSKDSGQIGQMSRLIWVFARRTCNFVDFIVLRLICTCGSFADRLHVCPHLSHVMRKPVFANNKGADQPAHPRSLISDFVVHCLDNVISILAIPEMSWASIAEQAGLSLI